MVILVIMRSKYISKVLCKEFGFFFIEFGIGVQIQSNDLPLLECDAMYSLVDVYQCSERIYCLHFSIEKQTKEGI
jgi:hypothetical protein